MKSQKRGIVDEKEIKDANEQRSAELSGTSTTARAGEIPFSRQPVSIPYCKGHRNVVRNAATGLVKLSSVQYSVCDSGVRDLQKFPTLIGMSSATTES